MRFFILAYTVCAIAACSGPTEHVSAYTLEACEPDATKIKKAKKPPTNDKCQGTSNGDNCDDLSSGKVDCIGDGNSGQGDDKKHNCTFPQPGCDADGCCDEEVVDEPDAPAPDSPDDGSGPIT